MGERKATPIVNTDNSIYTTKLWELKNKEEYRTLTSLTGCFQDFNNTENLRCSFLNISFFVNFTKTMRSYFKVWNKHPTISSVQLRTSCLFYLTTCLQRERPFKGLPELKFQDNYLVKTLVMRKLENYYKLISPPIPVILLLMARGKKLNWLQILPLNALRIICILLLQVMPWNIPVEEAQTGELLASGEQYSQLEVMLQLEWWLLAMSAAALLHFGYGEVLFWMVLMVSLC